MWCDIEKWNLFIGKGCCVDECTRWSLMMGNDWNGYFVPKCSRWIWVMWQVISVEINVIVGTDFV